MQQVLKTVSGACVLIIVAAAIGLTSNALRSDGLPLIRKPLSETRDVVSKDQLMPKVHIKSPKPKSLVALTNPVPITPPNAVVAPDTKTPRAQTKAEKPTTVAAPALLPTQQPTAKVVPLKTKAPKSVVSTKKIQALFTNLNDAKACFDNKSAIFLDARPTEDYEAEHITDALLLCFESVEEDYDEVIGDIPKDQLLITYCSDQQCASAIKLADALVARGHQRVVIMLEGLPGWKDAGYPTTAGKEAGG